MKVYTKCDIKKDLIEFNKRKASKDGLMYICKKCSSDMSKRWINKEGNREKQKEYSKSYESQNSNKLKLSRKLYRDNNKDRVEQSQKKFHENNPNAKKNANNKYLSNNQERRKKSIKDYYYKNKEKIAVRVKKYQKENPDKILANTRKYQTKKLKACPPWSELDKIKVLYEKCKWLESLIGLKYHVDHIIPLQGKSVSGLHVWDNLQILEATLNISKSNN